VHLVFASIDEPASDPVLASISPAASSRRGPTGRGGMADPYLLVLAGQLLVAPEMGRER
jgi:hypothetical protein